MPQTADVIQSFRKNSSLVSDVINEFKKPITQNMFFINKDFLIRGAKRIIFDVSGWHLRPENFANDYYGDPNFFYVVLLINDTSSRFNFRQNRFPQGIISPAIRDIQQVLSQQIS